jgi:hypothetical protein
MAKATEQGLNRRTVIRNLKNEVKFELDKRGYNKTFYRPTQVFWNWILYESIKTQDSFEEDQIVAWMRAKEEIDKQFDELQNWYFEHHSRIFRERDMVGGNPRLSPDNYKRLDSLVDRLMHNLESSLSVDFLAAGNELEDIYHLMVRNATDIISAYTTLWIFNSRIYAASKNCDDEFKHMTEALKPFRKRRDSQKRHKGQNANAMSEGPSSH